MLTQVFKSILLMSAVGSVLSVFWLCVKPITRKIFSTRWQYYIWLTVLIVMILPVRFSVPSRTSDIPVVSVNQSKNIETAVPQTDSKTADVQIPEQTEKISIPKIELPRNIFYYLANIWLLGMIAVLFAKIIKYNLFLRAIHKNSVIETGITSVPKRLTVRKTDMLDAPLIVGIFKPTLLLPGIEIAENDMNYILMHELTHYKRGDILYKWFAMIVSSVHWFNPFVYIVSRQIDTECEVSCDFAVTSKLSDNEKNNYMGMILDLLSNSKSNLRPLTTQMASEKKTMKRRFTMIRNKKATSKLMSAISVLLAAVMLSTTVFASGILTDLATDDYTIEILNNGEKIELTNKPFIENGEVYVPLRETFEKIGVMEHPDSQIEWDNGKIDLCIAFYADEVVTAEHQSSNNVQGVDIVTFIANHAIEIGKPSIIANTVPNLAGQDISKEVAMDNAPILKGSSTYIPYSYIQYLLHNSTQWQITYNIYDKNGNMIAFSPVFKFTSPTTVKTSQYDNTTPEYTIDQFFYLFENGNFENMKRYCTENCINTVFKDNRVFGMEKATLVSMDIAPTEYAKSSNDFNVFVSVTMKPHPESIYAPDNTSASFYVILQRQNDGSYLIDGFSTGV